MAESARTPSFSRGSRVLDYWLAHAEGLTVQPTGAVVEKVVTGPDGSRGGPDRPLEDDPAPEGHPGCVRRRLRAVVAALAPRPADAPRPAYPASVAGPNCRNARDDRARGSERTRVRRRRLTRGAFGHAVRRRVAPPARGAGWHDDRAVESSRRCTNRGRSPLARAASRRDQPHRRCRRGALDTRGVRVARAGHHPWSAGARARRCVRRPQESGIARGAPHRAATRTAGLAHEIVQIGWPVVTGCPSTTAISVTVPARWAATSFSIFIASTIAIT